MRIVVLLNVLVLLSACSNQAIYENLRKHKRQECSKVPHSEFQECLDINSKPYREYKYEYDKATNY